MYYAETTVSLLIDEVTGVTRQSPLLTVDDSNMDATNKLRVLTTVQLTMFDVV